MNISVTPVRNCFHILITGANGFVGKNIVANILEQEYKFEDGDYIPYHLIQVDDCSNSDEKQFEHDPKNMYFKKNVGEFAMDELSDETFPVPDVVIHLAAQTDVRKSMKNPIDDLSSNVDDTAILLDVLKERGFKGLFIFTSSGGAVYKQSPNCVPPFAESDPTGLPDSFYGLSKKVGEWYILKYALEGKFSSTILRLSNLYGYGAKKGIVHILDQAMINNEPTVILNGGEQTRDYLHIHDLAKVLKTLVMDWYRNKAQGYGFRGIFNIGTGVETSLKALYEQVKYFHPDWQGEYVLAGYQHGEVMRSVLDCRRFKDAYRKRTGKEFIFTPLQVGIANTIRFESIVRIQPELPKDSEAYKRVIELADLEMKDCIFKIK